MSASESSDPASPPGGPSRSGRMTLNQVTLPATDLERSVGFYRALGFRLIVDSVPRYARFECFPGGPSFSLHHVSWIPADTGVTIYFECDDLDERIARFARRGIAIESPPTDQSWLWREAIVRDPDGTRLCFYHAGENRLHPPWRVPDDTASGPSDATTGDNANGDADRYADGRTHGDPG